VKRIRDAGYEIVEDMALQDGHSHCYVGDPFGNRIELIAE
jgi:hypothetical protein